jgi:hypothetical protein
MHQDVYNANFNDKFRFVAVYVRAHYDDLNSISDVELGYVYVMMAVDILCRIQQIVSIDEVDYTGGAEIEIANAVNTRCDTTFYSEHDPEVGPNEFCFQLATQQFQSDVEICPEFSVAINFRWATTSNQITIIYIFVEDNFANGNDQFSTKILCDKMITGKPISNIFNDSILHALAIPIFLLRVFVDKIIASTCDARGTDFDDMSVGIFTLHGNNFRCQFVYKAFIQASLMHTEFNNVHILVHRISDDSSDTYRRHLQTYSANCATIQATQQQDMIYLHFEFKVRPDNALDATVASEIISGAVGPEVGTNEFCCQIDAVLDVNQAAIDQKTYSTMATSLFTDKYENVLFDDGDATSYKSNSSRESKCLSDTEHDLWTFSDLHFEHPSSFDFLARHADAHVDNFYDDVGRITSTELAYIYGTIAVNIICQIHTIGSIAHGYTQIHIDSFKEATFSSMQPVIDSSHHCDNSLIMSRDIMSRGLEAAGLIPKVAQQSFIISFMQNQSIPIQTPASNGCMLTFCVTL